MEHRSVKDLYNTLFASDIVTVSPKSTPPLKRPRGEDKENPADEQFMSPMKKAILRTVPTPERKHLMKEMQHDDAKIQQIQEFQEFFDPNYNQILENIGHYMEDVVSYYGKCPVCQLPTLRRYKSPNIPVADLICTNVSAHDDRCFLWQIKTSVGGYGSYFDKKKQYITVGSKKEGYLSHETLASASFKDKKIVVGYICIALQKTGPTNYRILPNSSFVLIPNFNLNLPEKYYEYVGSSGRFNKKDVVTWNSKLVTNVSLSLTLTKLVIDTNDVFYDIETKINPYRNLIATVGGRRKYILTKSV